MFLFYFTRLPGRLLQVQQQGLLHHQEVPEEFVQHLEGQWPFLWLLPSL